MKLLGITAGIVFVLDQVTKILVVHLLNLKEFGAIDVRVEPELLAVPVALGLILILLFLSFGSMRYALLIFSGIPLAAIGGVQTCEPPAAGTGEGRALAAAAGCSLPRPSRLRRLWAVDKPSQTEHP